MAVALTVDKIDLVEEGIREAYVEANGKFNLDPDRYAALINAGLDKKNKELLSKNKELSGKVKQSQTTEEKIKDLEAEVRRYKLENPARDLMLKHGVLTDRIDVAIADAMKYLTLDESGQVEVLDELGSPIDISLDRFFSTVYRDRRPFFYEASRAAGSGARNDRKGGGGQTSRSRASFDAMSAEDQMAFMKAGGTLTD